MLNGLGVPGFLRDADYFSTRFKNPVRVRVRRGSLFTVVSVNGLDMFFHRLSGRIDGVGVSPGGGHSPGATPASARGDAGRADRDSR